LYPSAEQASSQKMAQVWIPSLLRELTGGQEQIQVPGRTVREVIDQLDRLFPGIRQRLCDANGLRPGIAVAVDTQIAQSGLQQAVAENSEVHFLPAVSGG
jgi:molybdopterin synthase sulfur carrier subunit